MRFSRFLAELLEAVNPALAVIIAGGGTWVGYRCAAAQGENLTFGAGIGLVAGLVAAALICGLIANLSLIEQHLAYIADDIEEMRARDAGELEDNDTK
jgi:uridylate kinase